MLTTYNCAARWDTRHPFRTAPQFRLRANPGLPQARIGDQWANTSPSCFESPSLVTHWVYVLTDGHNFNLGHSQSVARRLQGADKHGCTKVGRLPCTCSRYMHNGHLMCHREAGIHRILSHARMPDSEWFLGKDGEVQDYLGLLFAFDPRAVKIILWVAQNNAA